jgi:hypothetical protein
MTRLLAVLLTAAFCIGISTAGHAAIGFRQLTGTYPSAVQRGVKSTVTVYSNYTLDGAYQVLFDQPGMLMTLAEPKPLGGGHNGKSRAGNPFRFNVEVPAEQPVRVYEYRIATPEAVSSVALLRVTDYPVVLETTRDNGSPATAQAVTLPATLCGKCDREVFSQRVLKGIHDMISTVRTDYIMDPMLTLLGPNGQVIGQNDNTFGGDSLLACKLPTAGSYVLEIRDARYGGHPKYTYCIEAAKRPFAQLAFPFVVERGKSAQARLIGPFCDDLPAVQLSSAANDTPGWKDVRFETSRGTLNPLPILVSEHPQQLAPEDHHSLAKAAPLKLPCGVSGQLIHTDEAHYYAFEARKGEYYRFEIESHRRGLPLDGVLDVFDASGAKVEGALADDKQGPGDDMPYHKDPALSFKAPSDGRFVLRVADLHGRGGPTFAYYLRAEPGTADFEIKGEYYYAMVAPGTRTVWFARVNRLNGFTGPVTVEVENLPPGVTCEPVTIPAGMTDCSLLLSAAADAKVNATLARVVGHAQVPGPDGKLQSIARRGRATCELQGEGGGQYLWPCQTQIVGVVEKLDLAKIEATPAEVTLAPGGKVEISVRIQRDKEFSDAVMLDMVYLYPQPTVAAKRGTQLPPGVTLGKASTIRLTDKQQVLEGKIVLEATKDALPVERLPITILAGVNISFSLNTVYGSNAIYLTIPAGNSKPAVAKAAGR